MKFSAILAGASLALMAASAHADVLFSLTGPTDEVASPGEISAALDSAGGPGQALFTIKAFGSLDGANVPDGNSDVFTLTLNGVDILSGSWNLGGGGQNIVFFAPPGTTAVPQSVDFGGGTLKVATTLDLIKGTNTLKFAFATANPKGLTDEGWALQDVSVTGAPLGASVPEPAAWALMVGGFFASGAAMRSARRSPPRNGEGHSQK